jgi:AraC-like DNA-binding protein
MQREEAKFWRAAEFDNLELLRATYITHSFDRHIHEGYAIGVIQNGAETFYYRGSMRIASAGRIVALNPGEIHTGTAVTEAGWTYRMLYPRVELLQDIAEDVMGRAWGTPYFPDPVMVDDYLAIRLRDLNHVLEHSTSSLERESWLSSTLGELILRHAARAPFLAKTRDERWAAQKARAYLREHYAENVSLKTLAAAAKLSPFHLVRLFRDEFGLPPHAYLTHVRVERAKTLLSQGWTIADVALAVGFTDQSHLTRRFKRIVGVSPGQYQRSR